MLSLLLLILPSLFGVTFVLLSLLELLTLVLLATGLSLKSVSFETPGAGFVSDFAKLSSTGKNENDPFNWQICRRT